MNGFEIKLLRKGLGMKTQKEFSDKLEVPLSTVKAWESEKHKAPNHLSVMLDYMEKQRLGEDQALKNCVNRAIKNALGRDYEKLIHIQNVHLEPDWLLVDRVVTSSGRWVFSVKIIPLEKVQEVNLTHGAYILKPSLPDYFLSFPEEPTLKEERKLIRETIKHVELNIDTWASKVIDHFNSWDKAGKMINEFFS